MKMYYLHQSEVLYSSPTVTDFCLNSCSSDPHPFIFLNSVNREDQTCLIEFCSLGESHIMPCLLDFVSNAKCILVSLASVGTLLWLAFL